MPISVPLVLLSSHAVVLFLSTGLGVCHHGMSDDHEQRRDAIASLLQSMTSLLQLQLDGTSDNHWNQNELKCQIAHKMSYCDMSRYQETIKKDFKNLLTKPQILEREWEMAGEKHEMYKPVLQSSASNCGSPSDPVQMKNFSISPDPLDVSSPAVVNLVLKVAQKISSPVRVDVTFKKKVQFTWIEIPYSWVAGSYYINDLCNVINYLGLWDRKQLSCNYPIASKEYNVHTRSFKIPQPVSFPEWITTGDYSIQAKGTQDGKAVFCFEFYLSLIASE